MTSKKLQPALIGTFVVLSIFLFAVAIVIFGGSRFFDKENTVIAYFDGSLQGLSIGAPVTYRGVTIGQVKDIKIHIREDPDPSNQISIPVLISLIPGKSLIVDSRDDSRKTEGSKFLEVMCSQGLRAKLKLQSLVTGKRYVDLAFYKNTIPVYRDPDGTYFEIPTIPSEMYQLSQVLQNIKIDELYTKVLNVFNSLEKVSSGLAKAMDSEQTQQLIDELSSATTNLNSILSQVDSQISPLLQKTDYGLGQFGDLTTHADQLVTSFDSKLTPFMDDIAKTLSTLDSALLQADQLLQQAGKTIQPNSPLYFRFTEAMHQLEETASSIQDLSNFLHRNPEALIYGLQKTGNQDLDQ